jgi:predicted phage terminase large subunit-like protein
VTLDDIDLYQTLLIKKARQSFWFYRQLITKDMIQGWWQEELAEEFQLFYEKMQSGERPKLAISAPPQHGKSSMAVDFITWVSGKNPALRTIYASYSKKLGTRANLACQRIFTSRLYKKIFPSLIVNETGKNLRDNSPTKTRELIEFDSNGGYFRNTTVRGSITGEGLDLGVLDDPIKGRKDANSQVARDATWEWFTSDFFSRFSEKAAFLTIATRWHLDDPIGRMYESFGDQIKILSYPALAEKNEEKRAVGEALFPKLKSKDFLIERKKLMSTHEWESLYQGNPTIIGGNIIHGENFRRYEVLPILKYRDIYADTAQKTKERNDFSVFQTWGYGVDGKIYLIDQMRGKWEAPELKRRAVDFWNKHFAQKNSPLVGQLRKFYIEDKASGTGLIQELKTKNHLPVCAVQRVVDKYTRVLDVLGYIESGYVMLPKKSDFVCDFISECEEFSADGGHKHDDQIDPMLDAISNMLMKNPISVWENFL